MQWVGRMIIEAVAFGLVVLAGAFVLRCLGLAAAMAWRASRGGEPADAVAVPVREWTLTADSIEIEGQYFWRVNGDDVARLLDNGWEVSLWRAPTGEYVAAAD